MTYYEKGVFFVNVSFGEKSCEKWQFRLHKMWRCSEKTKLKLICKIPTMIWIFCWKFRKYKQKKNGNAHLTQFPDVGHPFQRVAAQHHWEFNVKLTINTIRIYSSTKTTPTPIWEFKKCQRHHQREKSTLLSKSICH